MKNQFSARKTLGEFATSKQSEIDYLYPEQAMRRECPIFKYPCNANKCMGWKKAFSETDIIEISITVENKKYKDIWDGKTGGNPKLIKKIEEKKYRLEGIFPAWNDKQTLIARWIKRKKRRKGYCKVIHGKTIE